MDYDPAKRRLKIGKGYVENVTPEMWAYEVSGKHVLGTGSAIAAATAAAADRRPPAASPLDKIQPDHWLPEYTSDLLDLLHVLGRLIALEPRQADLLERICAGNFARPTSFATPAHWLTPKRENSPRKARTKARPEWNRGLRG